MQESEKNTQAACRKETSSRSRQQAKKLKLQQSRGTFSSHRTRKPGRRGNTQGWRGASHTEKPGHPRRALCQPKCQPQLSWAGRIPLPGFFCMFLFPFLFFIHLSMYNSGKIIHTASLKLHFTEFSADHEEAELTHAVPLTER